MLINFTIISDGEKKDKNTLDATLFEDLRYNAKENVSKCRKRLKNYIPKKGFHIF